MLTFVDGDLAAASSCQKDEPAVLGMWMKNQRASGWSSWFRAYSESSPRNSLCIPAEPSGAIALTLADCPVFNACTARALTAAHWVEVAAHSSPLATRAAPLRSSAP